MHGVGMSTTGMEETQPQETHEGHASSYLATPHLEKN